MELSKCLGCMEQFRGYPCPECGFDPRKVTGTEYALPLQTILAGKYMVGRVLGQGGFGITYIGWDIALERKVAIKEYYPSGQVSRSPGTRILTWYTSPNARNARQEGMQMFLKEARKMARLDEIPGVVKVRDLFQENETAYIIMDFVEGQTLKSLLQKGGPMSWEQAKEIFRPAIQAMEQVHQAGLIHRDLSPDNLMLTRNGTVKILDLGAAKDLNINSGASSMQVAKGGYSPLEQYTQRGGSGPWTDVYAMAATIYSTLTGTLPPNSVDRLESDALRWDLPGLQTMPAPALNALKRAMEVRSKDRIQSMAELAKGLFAQDKTQEPESAPEKKPSRWLIPAVAAALIVLCGAGFWIMQKILSDSHPSLAGHDTGGTTETATEKETETTTESETESHITVPETTQHEHTYSTDWACNETYHWYAATCGHGNEVSGLGEHIWDAGVVVTQSTHTTAGEMAYTCTVCGAGRIEVIPAELDAHVFDQQVVAEQYLASPATPSRSAFYFMSCTCGEKGTRVFSYGEPVLLKIPERGSAELWETVSAGFGHTVALKADGTVVAAGLNENGQCDVNDWTDIVAVSAGGYHTVGLKADGTVVAVGLNDKRQCNVSGWTDIVAISAGKYHTVALKSNGIVVAVGDNSFHQRDVTGWKDKDIVAISAGDIHTVGLKADGTVVTVGDNLSGQCDVSRWTDIVAISAGSYHTVGLKDNGTVLAMGRNDDGRCNTSLWTDIVAVNASGFHTVGLKADGTMIAVGSNSNGRCNVRKWTDIVAVSAGERHTVGLKADGTVVAVGRNDDHQCDVSSWTGIQTTSANRGLLKLKKTDITVGRKGVYFTLELENGISANSVNWSTSDPEVATVYNGAVTSVGKGVCVIRAEYNGQVAECVVRCKF